MKRKNKYIRNFIEYYMYIYEVKLISCLYFSAYIGLYFVFGWIDYGISLTLNLITALEMVLIASLLGVLFPIMVSKENAKANSTLLWMILSSVLSLIGAIYFKWFTAFSFWIEITCYLFFIAASIFMWFAVYWQIERETTSLNKYLKNYQGKRIRKNGDEYY